MSKITFNRLERVYFVSTFKPSLAKIPLVFDRMDYKWDNSFAFGEIGLFCKLGWKIKFNGEGVKILYHHQNLQNLLLFP